jgi:putative transposase
MSPMNWAAILGRITATVDQHLLARNRYLLAENRFLRSRIKGQMVFTDSERITLAKAAKPVGRTLLGDIATVVTPDTLLRWHRKLVENISTSQLQSSSGPGPPSTDAAIVQLILRNAAENPSWGYDRIVGALKELGHVVSDSTVGNILREYGQLPAPERSKGASWADFIAAHKDVLVGCDFFTKEVWTLLGPVTYYVLFFIHIASRKVHVAGVTRHPNQQWMQQIARNVTMSGPGFLDGMKYLILDRDAKFTQAFRQIIKSSDVIPLRLPPRAPDLNSYSERWILSVKSECLDRLILFGEASLHRALAQFLEHYHGERNHQGKNNNILFPTANADGPPVRDGPVLCRQRLGGLLKFYHRNAA